MHNLNLTLMNKRLIDEGEMAIISRHSNFLQNSEFTSLTNEEKEQIYDYLTKIHELDWAPPNDHAAIEAALAEQDQLLTEVKALYKKFIKANKQNDLATRKMP